MQTTAISHNHNNTHKGKRNPRSSKEKPSGTDPRTNPTAASKPQTRIQQPTCHPRTTHEPKHSRNPPALQHPLAHAHKSTNQSVWQNSAAVTHHSRRPSTPATTERRTAARTLCPSPAARGRTAEMPPPSVLRTRRWTRQEGPPGAADSAAPSFMRMQAPMLTHVHKPR